MSFPDNKDFIGYCLAWHAFVTERHHYEETNLFPAIEEAVGEKGVMNVEVAQHSAFHDRLQSFTGYLVNVHSRTRDFKPNELLEIMDSFPEPLHANLTDQLHSLLSPSRFSTPERPLDLEKLALAVGKKSVGMQFAFNIMPVFLLNMNHVEFDGGTWLGVSPCLETR